ncbi:SDR family NAD(P)-dependent oxidoreductase, partial [Archangium sp.]|uniref:SDR family NAD(P)-dependent oxidoreductase n=1 Tax=Archangium sp. TaxID=1872627 RepID=UPI002D574251
GVVPGRAVGPAPKVDFVFGGEGERYVAMGRELYETQPVFREALEQCGEALRGVLEKPLMQVLYGSESALLKEEAYGRAAVFALEWALARMWRAWGVVPRRVVGQGVGEYVAAVESGVLGLEEGLRRAVGKVPLVREETGQAEGAEAIHLHPGEAEWTRLLKTLGALYVKGVEVDWTAFDAPYSRRRVTLPTYPFQRQRYWWRGAAPRTALAPRHETDIAPHFGRRLRSPALDALVYETRYGPSRPAHLNDHRLFGTLVAAGSSHVSLVLSVIEDAYGSPACTLENLAFPQALVLADGEERTLQVILTPQEQGSAFEVKSLGDAGGAETWVLHASGGVRVGPAEQPKPWASREELLARCRERRSGDELYRAMREQGYTLGSGYQWISSVARGGDELLGEMRLPPLPDRLEDYPLYPGFVDSCFQVLASWTLDLQARYADSLLIPFSVARFTVHRRPRGTVWCHARIEGSGRAEAGEPIGGDLRIFDEQGLVAEVLGFRGRMASREAVRLNTHARREEARYEVIWRPEPEARSVPAPVVDKKPWVLLMDARGVGERLGRMLEEHGASVVRVRPGDTRGLDEAIAPAGRAGVVYLWGLDQPATEDASAESVQRAALAASGGALHLMKALAGRSEAPPVWLVTRGAQAMKETRPGLALAQAPLWGLGRVLDLEQPELRCTRVDLDPEDLEGSVRLLYAELGSGGGASGREVAFRGGVRLYPMLREDTGSRGGAMTLRADATYLLTGGLGGLGLEVARWMVEQGARHLVLVGRRAPSAPASEAVRALEKAGAHVTVASVDVSREAEVARLLQQLDAASPPLRGIVHAAGVLDDGALVQQDLERFERVMAPKVAGAWNLHRLTGGRPLDFFVLFSSASAMLGSPGQGNYAAANAFLDALAHERRARGLVAQSLDWGPWAETGMVGAADGNLARALERRGIRPLATRQALVLFGEALASGRPQVALMSVQWPVYLEALGPKGRSSFYEALGTAGTRAAVAPSRPRYPLAERLYAALPHERPRLLSRSLQEEIVRILRLDSTELDWRQGFAELGMDSLMAIELRNVLQKGLGVSVPATVALDHPTIDFLVRYLLDGVLKLDVQDAPGAAPDTLEKSLDTLSDAELARLVAEDLAADS